MKIHRLLILALALTFSLTSLASQQAPKCYDGDREVSLSNRKVLEWKKSTRNKFEARALIKGVIVGFYPDRNGHDHFQIQIGPNISDTIEVVYNQHFGTLPNLAIGYHIEVCGDYITAIAQSGPYPPSPDGAIIHWIHINPPKSFQPDHDHGYIMINGKLCGQLENC